MLSVFLLSVFSFLTLFDSFIFLFSVAWIRTQVSSNIFSPFITAVKYLDKIC